MHIIIYKNVCGRPVLYFSIWYICLAQTETSVLQHSWRICCTFFMYCFSDANLLWYICSCILCLITVTAVPSVKLPWCETLFSLLRTHSPIHRLAWHNFETYKKILRNLVTTEYFRPTKSYGQQLGVPVLRVLNKVSLSKGSFLCKSTCRSLFIEHVKSAKVKFCQFILRHFIRLS